MAAANSQFVTESSEASEVSNNPHNEAMALNAQDYSGLGAEVLALIGQGSIVNGDQGQGRTIELKDPLLSPEQLELIESHMDLAAWVARQYGWKTSTLTDEDLKSYAYIGLINAAQRFDPDIGTEFITFARKTMEGIVSHALRDDDRIIKRKRQDTLNSNKVYNAITDLKEAGTDNPSDIAVAAQSGLAVKTVRDERIGARINTVSYDTQLSANTDFCSDVILRAEDDGYAQVELRQYLNQCMERLSDPRYAEILRYRFGLGQYEQHTQEETGRFLGCSQNHVSRLEHRAMVEMQKLMTDAPEH